MNGETRPSTAARRRLGTDAVALGNEPARVLALVSALVLLGAALVAPFRVTDVVGETGWLVAFVAAAFLLATGLSRVVPAGLDLPIGLSVGIGIILAGLGGYLLLIPDVYYAFFSFYRVYLDTVALLAGQSVLLLLDADLWAIGIAPGPAFLTWYLALRGHYELSAIAGGLTLGFFTLTGDAGATATVIGMTGALGTLGFGSVDRWDGSLGQLQDVGLVLVAAVIATRFIKLVPDGGGVSRDVFDQGSTLEGTLVGSPNQIPVVGSITLSPEVRFTVRADTATYWRVASFDRYTGQGWVSTADARPYSGTLPGPPGEAEEIVQEFEFRASSRAMPAAWKPVFVDDEQAGNTRVTDDGGVQPIDGFEEGDGYRVVSRAPNWSEAELRESEKAYPGTVRDQYLQIPTSTSSRLEERAREIAEDVESPYVAMTNIRDWLVEQKSYSLDVIRPRNDVADRFVFEMDSGYCVYFATALTVMLRTIGVPARFVVGYSTGDEIGENRYRVRGLHSHAWTEVFFPETGWITVDPTPSEPRRVARERRLEERGDGGGGGDGGDGDPETTETPTTTHPTSDRERDGSAGNGTGLTPERTMPEEVRRMQEGQEPTPRGAAMSAAIDGDATAAGTDVDGGGDNGGGRNARTDAGDRLTLLAGVAGLVLGAYRIGVPARVYRSVWIRRQAETGDPRADVERAFERVEYLLAREHRSRRADETPRAYVQSLHAELGVGLDERIHRVLELFEKVRYSDDPRPEDAREAIRLVDELIDER